MKPCTDQIKLNNGKTSCGNTWCTHAYDLDTDCAIKEALRSQAIKKKGYTK